MDTEIEQVVENTPEYLESIQETKNGKYWLFQKGNTAYNLRTKAGISKLFETPEMFLTEALKYFNHADNNPWLKQEQLKIPPKAFKDDDGKVYFPDQIIEMPTQKPYTIEGLCLFLGITLQTFLNYEKKEGYNAFFETLSYVRMLIDNQQLEGGLVGAFNSAIVIRKLGLKEQIESKVEQTFTSIVFQTRTIEDQSGQDVTNNPQELLENI